MTTWYHGPLKAYVPIRAWSWFCTLVWVTVWRVPPKFMLKFNPHVEVLRGGTFKMLVGQVSSAPLPDWPFTGPADYVEKGSGIKSWLAVSWKQPCDALHHLGTPQEYVPARNPPQMWPLHWASYPPEPRAGQTFFLYKLTCLQYSVVATEKELSWYKCPTKPSCFLRQQESPTGGTHCYHSRIKLLKLAAAEIYE